MRRIILASVACMVLLYFSTLSHKRYDFRGNNLLNMKCVLTFSTILPETFLTVGSIQADINVHWSSCKVPVILDRFERNLNVLDRFSKNTQIPNFIKIRPVAAEFFSCGRTDRYDETNNRFSQCLRTRAPPKKKKQRSLFLWRC
jgi:hypothetical protein